MSTTTFPPFSGDAGGRPEHVSVESTSLTHGLRRFVLRSTQAQRDNTPGERTVDESPDSPQLHTGNLLFDALFAMALDDARLDSVSEIRDEAYNSGLPIPCECFQTGEKWPYVWTRDVSYAANLALAWLDPQRVVTSLLFKTSGWREGVTAPAGLPPGTTQILQDTGSGGSWPTSTDRVTWAWGAAAVLNALADKERSAFAASAMAALHGTLEADRLAAYDAASGLYGGEQSFLDWRAQSYAPWIVNNLSHMAASKSLSTNVAHYQALQLAVQLAREAGDSSLAGRYRSWAEDLRSAINRVFWLDDVQQYASLTTDDTPPVALHQFDLLGTALVIVSGVAPPQRAIEALAHYPHAPFGAPVIAPQQPHQHVYHNRAIWPFATAYALRAAAATKNTAIASNALNALVRAAALNLSNMENLEWLTGKPQFDDGPTVNSRRQLWSVAAYLSAVTESVFGLQLTAQGLHIAPFLTAVARHTLGQDEVAVLSGFRYLDRTLSITLRLPPAVQAEQVTGYYPVSCVSLNGHPVDGPITRQQLDAESNRIEVLFEALVAGESRIVHVPAVDPLSRHDARVFAPLTPVVHCLRRDDGALELAIAPPRDAAEGPLHYDIYRNGHLAAAQSTDLTWVDPRPVTRGVQHRYAVQVVSVRSGHRSHFCEPIYVEEGAVKNVRPGEVFSLPEGGRFAFGLLYDNHAYAINTGITNAVKILVVRTQDGREATRGVVQMPHIDAREGRHPLRRSTAVQAVLPSGFYRAELLDFFNMSYLQANARYGGPGGTGGPLNAAHIEALLVIALPDTP